MRGVCPPATSLRNDFDLHVRRSRMMLRRCIRATRPRTLGSASTHLGQVHTSCGWAPPWSAVLVNPPGGNLDLGVDFFLRTDRLNPDQHPAWTSGSGLIVGEGMIMAEGRWRTELETQRSQQHICAAELSAFTTIFPRCVASAHKHDSPTGSPDPGPSYIDLTQKANLITTWCLFQVLKHKARYLQTHAMSP